MDSDYEEVHRFAVAVVQEARQEVRLLRLTFESWVYFITHTFRSVRFTVPVFQ